MDFQKAIGLIEKSEYVGILLPEDPSLDCLAAGETLAHALKEAGKFVGFLGVPRAKEINKEYFRVVASASVLPHEFIITLNTVETPISRLRYEKGEERIDVVISPKSSSLGEENVTFRQGKILCDCIFTLGIPDIETLNGNTAGFAPNFFTETPCVNIDNSAHNKTYAEVNLINAEKVTISEIVYDFFTAWHEKPLPQEYATLIFSALISQTNFFKTKETNADTLLLASELMRIGANHEEASQISKTALPSALLQLSGRAAVRSKFEENQGVLWSFLTAEDFGKTGRSKKDISHIFEFFKENFPTHTLAVLLAQPSMENSITAFFSGNEEILQAIRDRVPAEFQSPHLELRVPFNSFQEGEEYVSILLKEVMPQKPV